MGAEISYDVFFLIQCVIGVLDMVFGYLLVRSFVSYYFIAFISYHALMMLVAILLLAVWLLGHIMGNLLRIRIGPIATEQVIVYMHPIILLFVFNAMLLWVTVDLSLQDTNNTWNNAYAIMLFTVGVVLLGCARIPPRKLSKRNEDDGSQRSAAIQMATSHENPNKYDYPIDGNNPSIPIGEDIRLKYPSSSSSSNPNPNYYGI
jgi:hypothetical protein